MKKSLRYEVLVDCMSQNPKGETEHREQVVVFRKDGIKLSGKEATPLATKTVEMLASHKGIIHTLTIDNGKEFAKHADFAGLLEIEVYFAHPYHSWERGANENTNGLIRQYIPKGSDFAEVSDDYIAELQNILNNRPRKRLGFMTLLEVARELHPEYF